MQVVGDHDVRPPVRGDVADGEAVRVAAVRVRNGVQVLARELPAGLAEDSPTRCQPSWMTTASGRPSRSTSDPHRARDVVTLGTRPAGR